MRRLTCSLLITVLVGAATADDLFLFDVPKADEKTVTIDGVVEKREWYGSAQFPFLHDVKSWFAVNRHVQLYMQHDDESLYVGFVVGRPKNYGRPKIVLTKENEHLGEAAYGLAGNEDRVRIVVVTDSGRKLEVTGNAALIFQTKVNGAKAKSEAAFLSRAEGDRWEGEVRIPLSEIENAKSFRFDFVNLQATPEERTETLSYRRSLDDDKMLWRVNRAANCVTGRMRTEDFGRIRDHAIWLDCWNNSDKPADVELSYAVAKRREIAKNDQEINLDQAAKKLSETRLESKRTNIPSGAKALECIQPFKEMGEFVLLYAIKSDPKTVCRGILFIDVESPLHIELTPYFLKYKKLRVTVDLGSVKGVSKDTVTRFALTDSNGQVVGEQQGTADPKKSDVSVLLDTDKLKEDGKYKLEVKPTDHDKVLAQRVVPFVRPKNPDWWGKKLGLSMEVPPPFQPLSVSDSRIELWKRTYEFSGKLFPQSIRSRETELLASPMELRAVADDKPLAWANAKLERRDVTPGKAVFAYHAENAQVRLKADMLCEFDGMIRYDVEIIPAKASARLDRLRLEIPMKKEYAELYAYGYLYTDLEKAKGHDNEGKGLSFGFVKHYFERRPTGRMPFCAAFYLGTDDRGIQWFAENDKDWINENEDEVLTLEEKDDRMVLCIPFIDKPTVIDKPLKFTWGIIATPIRDTSWEQRNFKAAAGDIGAFLPGGEERRSHVENYLRSCAEHGMKYIGTYHQMKGQFGTPRCFTEEETRAFKAYGDHLKTLGLSYDYYSGWGVTANIPGAEVFSREMFAEPVKQVGYGTYTFNLNSPYLEYYLDGVRYMVREAGAVGTHLDSTYIFFRILANELDGYRFEKNGKAHGSWPIFAMRNFARRLYTMHASGEISKERGIVHAGYSYPLYAVGGFVTVRGAWEDYYHRRKLKEIPLDYFRLRSADVGNGVYARFSWANWLKLPLYANEMMTLCLLHGIRMGIGGEIAYPVQAQDPYGQKSNPQGLLNDLFDKFDAAGAEFHPYYKNEPFLKSVTPSHILCTVYLYPGKKAIVILGNIEDAAVEARVELNWDRFGLEGKKVEVRDGLLPDVRFVRDGEAYVVPIQSQRYRVLVVNKIDG